MTGARRLVRAAGAVALVLVLVAVLAAGCSGGDAGDGGGDGGAGGGAADAGPPKVVPDGIAVPAVTGPVTEGRHPAPFNTLPPEIAEEYGYVEEEYLVEGTAASYVAEGDLTPDGDWTLAEDDAAPYTTRILVRMPADPEDFNGTVVVEWLNVSGGIDADPHFGMTHPALLGNGFGYVGVSAQAAGIEGGGFRLEIPGFDPEPLKEWDPERYGGLSHPGDDHSYDIFTQAAAVAAGAAGPDPFEGYGVQRLLAVGESQSAMRLVSYINGVHPLTGIFDGFLVHSRSAGAAPVQARAADEIASGDPVRIRTDLDVPVLVFQTETDLVGVIGFLPARQPDTELIRTWEVAGTAHADRATLDYGVASGLVNEPDADIRLAEACGEINTGPQRFVVRRALVDLERWVRAETLPAHAEPIAVEDGAIVRDEHGNAVGGVRTPAVDVPIATQSGEPPEETDLFCLLFGHHDDFDEATLADLYDGPDDYVEQVAASATGAVEAGFLLPEDEARIVAAAETEAAAIPDRP
ncbi:MAG: alpha/beta hydrolase domain-containing protein [Acidimicrobiia bacterium]